MNKAELAAYLVSLHNLLQAQSSAPISTTSAWLAEEYDRCWAEFRETIHKENENEGY